MPVYLDSFAEMSGERKGECNPNTAEIVIGTFLVFKTTSQRLYHWRYCKFFCIEEFHPLGH